MTVTPASSPRRQILETAAEMIDGDRARTYGDANKSFARIGILWGGLLDRPALSAAEVGAMMTALKLVRGFDNPGYADSWIDAAGYIALAGEAASK